MHCLTIAPLSGRRQQLAEATFGGESWSIYFDLLASTSAYTGALFLFVVGFTQIGLLNIMTGAYFAGACKDCMI